jgi:hypothetical protein
MPSKVIDNITPVERLLETTPDYKSLRVFGCACWPNLRPYNSRKLAFRSKQCVFLGYSPRHKGVKCLEVSTGRIYISRDVVFDENIFPFASLHPNAGALLRKEILLLPNHLGLTHGDANDDNHMPTNASPMPVTSPVQIVAENSEQNNQELSENSTQTAGYFMQENNGPNSTADLVTGADYSGATNSGAGSPPSRASSAAAGSHAAEDQSTPTRGQSGADTPASGRATSAPAGPAGGSGTTPGATSSTRLPTAHGLESGATPGTNQTAETDCVAIEPRFFRVIFRGTRNRVAPGTMHGILCSARSYIPSCGTHTSSTRNP